MLNHYPNWWAYCWGWSERSREAVKPEGQRRNAKNPSSQTNCSCAKLKWNLVILLFEKYRSYFYEQWQFYIYCSGTAALCLAALKKRRQTTSRWYERYQTSKDRGERRKYEIMIHIIRKLYVSSDIAVKVDCRCKNVHLKGKIVENFIRNRNLRFRALKFWLKIRKFYSL